MKHSFSDFFTTDNFEPKKAENCSKGNLEGHYLYEKLIVFESTLIFQNIEVPSLGSSIVKNLYIVALSFISLN